MLDTELTLQSQVKFRLRKSRLSRFLELAGIQKLEQESSKAFERFSDWCGMAERVGFEPTVGVNLHTLSKRAP